MYKYGELEESIGVEIGYKSVGLSQRQSGKPQKWHKHQKGDEMGLMN